ncbi:hypothetical protein BHE74_00059288, partial [Ensete ventricosum]
QPGIGGEVVPHQDNSFLYTEPPSCTGLWLALEDATTANGCLWAIPGSHKNGLKRRFIRDENGVHFDHPSPSYDHKEFVPVEVKEGSLVVIHGDLIHQSFENKSPNSRHALSLHVVDTDGHVWAKDNWLVYNILGLCRSLWWIVLFLILFCFLSKTSKTLKTNLILNQIKYIFSVCCWQVHMNLFVSVFCCLAPFYFVLNCKH